MESKKISLLGSTGSIGQNTLKVAAHLGIEVVALAAKSNIDLLEEQARCFHPQLIAVFDQDKALELAGRLPRVRVVGGMEGLNEAAALEEATHVVSAMSGTVGILPTATALINKKQLLLANKEALVSAGEIMMRLARENGTKIIPVDSEHSALFQCFQTRDTKEVHRLILTASGGPFRGWSHEELQAITVEKALEHPTWKMGPKITIDCSTLMNKGMEVIEAHHLFGIPIDQIEVLIHPQSVIHGMVQFIDGSTLAQLSNPHMIYPIQYALTHPIRKATSLVHLDLTQYGTLEFFSPDIQKFPCLQLAIDSLRVGGSMPCFMNAANETLVQRFILKEISWNEIGKKLEKLMEKHTIGKETSLEGLLAVDAEARFMALKE